jgi:hypothetical protein
VVQTGSFDSRWSGFRSNSRISGEAFRSPRGGDPESPSCTTDDLIAAGFWISVRGLRPRSGMTAEISAPR